MEIDKLVHIVKNPKDSSCKEIEIDSLKEKFPYCQTFTLISMMQKHEQGVFGFEEELENSAHKIIDRAVLYDYLHHETAHEFTHSETITNETQQNDLIASEVEPVVEETNLAEATETEEEENEKLTNTSFTELDFHIINSAIDSSIQQDVEEEISASESGEENTQEITVSIPELVEQDVSEHNLISETNQETIIPIEENEIDSSPKSFIHWLKNQETTPIPDPTEKESEKTTDLEEITKTDFKSQVSKKDILDKFINEEPRISKPKKEFFSPTKKAKESLAENDDIITETLAKIYVLQKNYNKAIEAYEKLSLIYPEKNTFFANQINRIKDKQNI